MFILANVQSCSSETLSAALSTVSIKWAGSPGSSGPHIKRNLRQLSEQKWQHDGAFQAIKQIALKVNIRGTRHITTEHNTRCEDWPLTDCWWNVTLSLRQFRVTVAVTVKFLYICFLIFVRVWSFLFTATSPPVVGHKLELGDITIKIASRFLRPYYNTWYTVYHHNSP